MSDTDRIGDSAGEHRTALSSDSSAMGTTVNKVCCMCGVDLHGRTRYKDSSGRYWCPTCNEKDRLAKEPATCPDCNQSMTRADLVDFKGTAVCQSCWEKRRAAAKREEARLRALEEAIREEEERKRRLKIYLSVGLIMVALWAIAYAIYWFIARSAS